MTLGYLISYDYDLIWDSLELTYSYVDKILLSHDKDFISWSNNKYDIPKCFFKKIKDFDVDNKIEIIQNDYRIFDNPMSNEIYQRNELLKAMQPSHWFIQLDVDEYPLFFNKFCAFLRGLNGRFPFRFFPYVNFTGKFLTVIKVDLENKNILYVEEQSFMTFATNKPWYTSARRNQNLVNYELNLPILHFSYGRSSDEVKKKLLNWGHKNDFDTNLFFEFWDNLNNSNYIKFKNFHPLNPPNWSKCELGYFDGSISKLIKEFEDSNKHFKFNFNVNNYLNSWIEINVLKPLRKLVRRIIKKLKYWID